MTKLLSYLLSYWHLWIDKKRCFTHAKANDKQLIEHSEYAIKPCLSLHFVILCQPLENIPPPFFKHAFKHTFDSLSQQGKHWQASLISPCHFMPYLTSVTLPPFTTVVTYNDFSDLNPIISKVLCNSTASHISIVPLGTQFAKHMLDTLLFTAGKTDADIIYADDDLIQRNFERHSPHFKPAWNPDYFYAYNYFSYTAVLKYSLLLELDATQQNDTTQLGYSQGFYEALLSDNTKLNTLCIEHIPNILFHFPEHIGRNTITIKKNKPYFVLPRPSPLVSLIIPTRDELLILKQCIASLIGRTAYPNIEILIIDNQSKEQATLDYLQEISHDSRITVLQYPYAFNYSAINNFAVQQAKGTLLAFVNNDIECINSGWLTEMVSHACRDDIGCVGAKLYYPDGTIQHGGIILGIKGTASHAHKYFSGDHPGYFNRLSVVHNVSAVTAACLVMRKALFKEVGGFDEINLKVAYNDVDLCLKVLKLGYRNLWTPHAELTHYESKSRGKQRSWWQRRKLRKEAHFLQKKWGELLFNDPAYNPNLTLEREDFSLKEDI